MVIESDHVFHFGLGFFWARLLNPWILFNLLRNLLHLIRHNLVHWWVDRNGNDAAGRNLIHHLSVHGLWLEHGVAI